MQVPVEVAGRAAIATIDGGSTVSLMSERTFNDLTQCKNFKLQRVKDKTLRDIQGNCIKTLGAFELAISLGGKSLKDTFHIVQKVPSDLLLGRPFLSKHNVVVDHKMDIIEVGGKMLSAVSYPSLYSGESRVGLIRRKRTLRPLRIEVVQVTVDTPVDNMTKFKVLQACEDGPYVPYQCVTWRKDSPCLAVQVVNASLQRLKCTRDKPLVVLVPFSKDEHLSDVKDESEMDDSDASSKEEVVASVTNKTDEQCKELISKVKLGKFAEEDPEVKKAVEDLMWEYRHLWAGDPWDLGSCTLPNSEHKIKLRPDAKPRRFQPYRSALAERELHKEHLVELLVRKQIRPSDSEWGSPMYLISKSSDGSGKLTKRIIVDMSYVNAMAVPDGLFLPRMDDLLDALAGSRVYSTLDLAQFYFQLRLHPDSQDICAFNTPFGLYAPNYVVQGDQSAPPVAQRIISQILAGIPHLVVLIDDIAIGTNTTEEMLDVLRQVFGRLSKYNLKLKPVKANLLTNSIPFLGHRIEEGKLIQSEEKVERVKKWPRPRTSRDIKRFLGFLGFWRQFIKGMSHHAKPLIDLENSVTGRIKDEEWLPVHQRAFDTLKRLAITAPVLHLFEHRGGRAHLYVDASEVALGALLAQEVYEKVKAKWQTHPVAYASRLLRGAEVNYDISDLEGLAVMWGIKKFRPYLHMTNFDLHTDSQTVYHLFQKPQPDLGKRLGRFHASLLGYSFRIFKVKGHKNPADPLSRLPTVRNKKTGALEYLEEDMVLEKRATGEDTEENEDDEDDFVAVIEDGELQEWYQMVEEQGRPDGETSKLQGTKEGAEVSDDELFTLPKEEREVEALHEHLMSRTKEDRPAEGQTSQPVLAVQTRAQKRILGYEEVARQQKDDSDLKPIFTALRSGKKYEVNGMEYLLKDGVLFVKDAKKRERLVVPRSAVRDLLVEKHSLPQTGHPGSTKLYEELSGQVYWRNMSQDIAQFVKHCDLCQRHKSTYEHIRTPLGSLPRPTSGFEVMAMDVMGPFNQRADRNRYVIVVVDLFTRFGWAKAMPNQTGKAIAEFLISDVFKFGTPKMMLSDQGKNLNDGVVDELHKMLGVKKLRSSPYFPSGNGAAERLCGTLGTMVRLATAQTQSQWSKLLPQLVNKYNNTRHRAIGEKPIVTAFGREPVEHSPLVPKERKRYTGQGDYIQDLKERRKKAEELAQKALDMYYTKTKEYHDAAKKVEQHSFTVGQYVLVKRLHNTPNESKKLEPKYYGPAEIMEVGEHTARIRFLANGFSRIRNVSHLRPYFWDSEDAEVPSRFTAPKRRNKRFDQDDDVEESRQEEISDGNELVTGVSPSSPYKDLLKTDNDDDNREQDSDDDDTTNEKHVTFADDV